VKILELLAKSRREIGELVEEIGKPELKRREVFCPREKKGRVMRALLKETEGIPRDLIDGIRLHYPGGWILLLPDPRRPFFRILSEFADPPEGEKLSERFMEKIKKIQEEGEAN